MPELITAFGLLKQFGVDVQDLIKATKQLMHVGLDKPAKQELAQMLDEATKTYGRLAAVMAPVSGLAMSQDPTAQFQNAHAVFKQELLQGGDIGTSCHLVIAHLQRLGQGKVWQKSMPLLGKERRVLDYASDNWAFHDDGLAVRFRRFVDAVNRQMDRIASLLPHDVAQARVELRALNELEPAWRDLRDGLGQLKVTSIQLTK